MNPNGLTAELVLPGTAGNDVTTQPPASYTPGAMRVTVGVTPATVAKQECFIGLWSDEATDDELSWAFAKTASGQLSFYRSLDGTTSTETNTTGVIPSNTTDVRVTFDPSAGVATWYYSTDHAGSFTSMGSKTIATGALFAPTRKVPFRIGNRGSASTAFPLAANLRYATIEAATDGSGGTVTAVDFRSMWQGSPPTYRDPASLLVWHLRGSTWKWQLDPTATVGLTLPAAVTFPVTGADVADPSAPAAGNATLYPKSVAGRDQWKTIEGSGVGAYALQTAIYERPVAIVGPGTATTPTSVGTSLTNSGTISHPSSTEALGKYINAATAASVGSVAGVGGSATRWRRGSVAGANGFFHRARFCLPDAAYTSARCFVGFTGNSLASALAADDPGSAVLAFTHSTGLSDTEWKFAHAAGAASVVYDSTGLAFTPQHVYDATIACLPQGGTVYWILKDLTSGTQVSGSTSATLPSASSPMLACTGVASIDGTAYNVGILGLYTEGGTF